MQTSGSQLCLEPSNGGSKHGCKGDSSILLPVPVITSLQMNDSASGDPELASVLQASYHAFETMRSILKQPNNTFLTGLAWL